MRTARLPMPLLTALLALLLMGAGLGLRDLNEHLPPPLASRAADTGSTPQISAGCLPSHDGYLRARLRSATVTGADVDIDWHDADMECDGGPRPDAQGMRLTFAGRVRANQHRWRLVFGLAAQPQTREAHNVPTNITLIDEDEQRLFSTAGDTKCTIDALTLQATAGQPEEHWQRFAARGFCTGPATALGSGETLLVDRFDFAGIVRDE